jgi:hypothetical protein
VSLTVIVSGMVAGVPGQGGAAWAVLQYVLGLRRLGHDVHLVEPVGPSALRPAGASLPESANAAYFAALAREFGLTGRSALLGDEGETVGLSYRELLDVAARADLLINVSGMLADDGILARVPVRVYLDLDPAFNQLWHAVEGIDVGFGGHTHFATVGHAIGRPGCSVPTCELEWIPTLQPVVLDRWPVAERTRHEALTTVANWRGYGSIDHDGTRYGQKAHALRPLFALPRLARGRFVLALAIHPDERADLEALRSHGWELLDPAAVAATPRAYADFVRGSWAEFGIAKSGYAASRCGWFSDRSACYLASGRPVVAHDTGFGGSLPTGEGLFAFATADDVLDAIEQLQHDYPRHARAAREIAEEYLDSDVVLGRLLERVAS